MRSAIVGHYKNVRCAPDTVDFAIDLLRVKAEREIRRQERWLSRQRHRLEGVRDGVSQLQSAGEIPGPGALLL